jgi:hypothetical protein
MHFPGMYREIHAAECPDRTKALADPAHLEDGLFVGGHGRGGRGGRGTRE